MKSALAVLLLSAAAAGAGDAPVVKTAGELTWIDSTVLKGAKQAVLWGDPTKAGAWGAIKRMPAGVELPMHTHTNASRVVELQGTITLTFEGMPAKALAPMSFADIPAGHPHSASCGKDSECVYLEQMTGPYDFAPVAAKK